MKLLVTGAGGFVGRAVVDEARSRGHDVVAVVRSTKGVPQLAGVSTVVGDLRQDGPWVAALAGCDAVIHLAASSGDFYDQMACTVLGTERLLTAMRDNGVKRLVHVSTFSVYDYRAISLNGWLDETSPLELRPEDRDDYTQTKLVQEQLVRSFAASIGEVVIIRPGAIYGPEKLWDAGLTVRLFGTTWAAIAPNGCQKLTYVGNCALAIVLAAEVDGAIGQILNIVDDDLPTQREYAAALARHGFDVPRALPIPYRLAAFGAAAIDKVNRRCFGGRARLPAFVVPAKLDARFKPFQYDNDRAKRVLGWHPAMTLDEALATIASSGGIAEATRGEAPPRAATGE
jgi:nucleoside-diphosphate-sugar epimerase